jgi:hypothetical protein
MASTHRAGAGVDAHAEVGADVVGHHLLRDGRVAALGAALAAVAEEPARGHQLEDARERALRDDGRLRELRAKNKAVKRRSSTNRVLRPPPRARLGESMTIHRHEARAMPCGGFNARRL